MGKNVSWREKYRRLGCLGSMNRSFDTGNAAAARALKAQNENFFHQ
jgi:hypothetical protein